MAILLASLIWLAIPPLKVREGAARFLESLALTAPLMRSAHPAI